MTRNVYKYMKYLFLFMISFLFLFQNISFGYETTDLMQQVFDTSIEYGAVLKVGGLTSKEVGIEVLRGKSEVTAGDDVRLREACLDPETDELIYIYKDGEKTIIDDETMCVLAGGIWSRDFLDIVKEPPLIVKIAKILLRITMVLGITMIIFNCFLLLLDVLAGKDLKSGKMKNNIILIVVGVILALMSVTITNLVLSMPKSSLSTSNDTSYINL